MEYYTANTYKNAERIGEPFEKKGKLYTKIKYKCPRCSGLGIIAARVENDQIIPIPVDQGICYQCRGNKFIYNEVRLYTPKEKEQMEKANKRAKERREAERQAEIEASFAKNKADWLNKNEFDEEGFTYIITGDSYAIKDELKHSGWKFDPVILWHKANPAGYEDRVIKVHVDQIFSFTAWGKGMYKEGAMDIVKALIKETLPPSNSEWVGEIGKRMEFNVKIVGKGGFESRFGYSNIYKFETSEGNKLTWFTTSNLSDSINEGDEITIKATVKSHDTYNDEKVTIITRAKLI